MSRRFALGSKILAAVAVAMLALPGCASIEPGSVGVVTDTVSGNVDQSTLPAGMHFVGFFKNVYEYPAGVVDNINLDNFRVNTKEGQEITVEVFGAGQTVDVSGTTKGKGFAGVMKRHGFHGVSASHGSHRNHRKPGSIGACATPSRVLKGVRMAGRMGNVRLTTQNLTVHAIDAERGLLLVKGAIPGPKGGVVVVKTASKGA